MPTPNSINSNSTSLAFAEEQSLKVLPGGPIWYGLEPNTYTEMGATFATIARTPITNTRQQAKGTITDLDAKAGFNTDLTQRNVTRLLQGFFFADAIEKMATNRFNFAAIVITAVTVGPNTYTAAAGLNAFLVGHLVIAKGFTNAGNNGLKFVSAIAAGVLTTTTAGEVAEAAPPAGASIEAVGYQFPASDLVLTIVGATVVLTSAAKDPTTFGLTVGEWIYVGGDGAAFKYATGATFFGRIKSISATQIILDATVGVPLADTGVGKTIQIFFGKVLQNAPLPANIKRRSYQLERQMGNDGAGIQSEILLGAIANELTINLQQASKVTIDLSFVGMDVSEVSGVTGIAAGTRVAAPAETAFNTSHDLVAARLAVIDPATSNPAALFAYLTDIKLSIKNGVAPNKALAVLGAFDAVQGNFVVDGTAVAYFATIAAASSIRNNSDVGLVSILAKSNSGIVMDLPLLQLGGGLAKVVKDKPVDIDLTTTGAQNAAGYTLLWNFFEYLPTIAMPV